MNNTAQVILVKGDDEAVVASELRIVLEALIGTRDATLVVEEHGDGGAGKVNEVLDVATAVDAFTTAPFLMDRRIVVLRDVGRVNADGAKQLLDSMAQAPETCFLVMAQWRGKMPVGLTKAVNAHGELIDVAVSQGAAKKKYLSEHLKSAPVRLNAAAAAALAEHLGEDLGRLGGLLDTLAQAYGDGVTIDPAMLEPFLGARGNVPIYELTGKIEDGKVGESLNTLTRLMGPGGTSAHQVVALLDKYFTRVARLDGSGVRSGDEAAELLGVSSFPGKKLFALSKKMDHEKIVKALNLIGDADLDLKGMSGLSEQAIAEVLVTRLARDVGSKSRPKGVTWRR